VAAVTQCLARSVAVVIVGLSSQRCHNYCGDSYCRSLCNFHYAYCGYCFTVVAAVIHSIVQLLLVRCSTVLKLILLVI
jgi:hypothetical protein